MFFFCHLIQIIYLLLNRLSDEKSIPKEKKTPSRLKYMDGTARILE